MVGPLPKLGRDLSLDVARVRALGGDSVALSSTGLSGSGTTYTFAFDPPPFGTVDITWDAGHLIQDYANPPHDFDHAAPGLSPRCPSCLDLNAPAYTQELHAAIDAAKEAGALIRSHVGTLDDDGSALRPEAGLLLVPEAGDLGMDDRLQALLHHHVVCR